MKTVTLVSRLLLGFIFLVFGLNGFLNFLPAPAPTGVAAQFLGALFTSHYLVVVFLVQLIPAILLLANRYVPLALTLLGPVIVNILCFHAFMAPAGLPLALLVAALWTIVYLNRRSNFAGLFER
jgi:putative oxidoreductase